MASFREVGHCIWQAVGKVPHGKHVTILGGVHGNELTGVQVVEQLKASCPPLLVGTLTLILGNPKAIEINERGSAPHADLNRHFTIDLFNKPSSDATYEELRAKEIAPYLQNSDLVLDLHATNKPSVPFLKVAGQLSSLHYNVFRWFPCDTILHDPSFLLAGKVALTDEYTGFYGGVGMIYESGLASDVSRVPELHRSVLHILSTELSVIEHNNDLTPTPQRNVFEVTEVFRLPPSGFQWSCDRGGRNFDCVPPHAPIGVFGDGRVLQVPYESYIVFPKVPSLWKLGS
ncbi:Aste57867_18053 [Aphanomyces stellatus]|uniref:Aste57867_18053 protein n=1 Tax=Aphanomyces stellatus TaxID=120398 RepID=A0A485L934_9STRA|nr:hypothetical protein As57867_017991 [Aphanomyces stellatus]VFT94792.1 Aste57867_18053 [Aphanomyces stellatus]